jgi:hypothetical protein
MLVENRWEAHGTYGRNSECFFLSHFLYITPPKWTVYLTFPETSRVYLSLVPFEIFYYLLSQNYCVLHPLH